MNAEHEFIARLKREAAINNMIENAELGFERQHKALSKLTMHFPVYHIDRRHEILLILSRN